MSALAHSTRCLFGGTILAAGLMGQAAQAQTFNLSSSFAAVYATFGGSDTFGGAGPFSIGVSDAYGNVANSWGHATSLGADGYSRSSGYGFGRLHFAYFTVSADGVATAEWDFTGDQNYQIGWFELIDLTNNQFVLQKFWADGAGSESFVLSSGVDYLLGIEAIGSTGYSFAHLTIPTPASAALLGVGGLLATRRRRE